MYLNDLGDHLLPTFSDLNQEPSQVSRSKDIRVTFILSSSFSSLLMSIVSGAGSCSIHGWLHDDEMFIIQGSSMIQSVNLFEATVGTHMTNEKSIILLPYDMKSKLADKEGKPITNAKEYRSLAGALQYLAFMTNSALSTKKHGLQLLKQQSMSLVAYSDADWAGFVISFQRGGCIQRCSLCCYIGVLLVTTEFVTRDGLSTSESFSHILRQYKCSIPLLKSCPE